MRPYDILGYGLHGPNESNARFTFGNGTSLVLAPCRNGSDLAGCLKAALFYDRTGGLVAAVSDIENESAHKHGQPSIWTRDPIPREPTPFKLSHDLLVRLWNRAVQKGAQLSERHAQGRIPETEWNATYWEVWTISRLGYRAREAFGQKQAAASPAIPSILAPYLHL